MTALVSAGYTNHNMVASVAVVEGAINNAGTRILLYDGVDYDLGRRRTTSCMGTINDLLDRVTRLRSMQACCLKTA